MSHENKPRILIVGGGLAGLGLAGFLHQKGVQATVVEKAPEWRRVGWGIGLWPNGLAVLQKLGAHGAVCAAGTAPSEFEIGRADGTVLASFEGRTKDNLFLAVHRADLHKALLDRVPPEWIRMGTTPDRFTRRGGRLEVGFDTHASEEFDCVIGADGVHSAVGQHLFPQRIVEPRDTLVWSFWAPESAWDIGNKVVSLWAAGIEAFLVQISGRLLVNIAARSPEQTGSEPPALDLLGQIAEGGGDALAKLVAARDEQEDVFFDRVRQVKLGEWRCGRALLIGDAAHALHPISGMGAALALEDGYVLAEELVRCREVADALEAFEARRRKRVGAMRRLAHVEERIVYTDSPVLSSLRDAAVRWTPAWKWTLERQLRKLRRNPLSKL